MRKVLLLIVALLAVMAAVVPAPQVEAYTTCSWACGPCGPICPCGEGNCPGPPRILCVCG